MSVSKQTIQVLKSGPWCRVSIGANRIRIRRVILKCVNGLYKLGWEYNYGNRGRKFVPFTDFSYQEQAESGFDKLVAKELSNAC